MFKILLLGIIFVSTIKCEYRDRSNRQLLQHIIGWPLDHNWLHKSISEDSDANRHSRCIIFVSTIKCEYRDRSNRQLLQHIIGWPLDHNWLHKSISEDSDANRHSRFLSLFTVVNFNNQGCLGATGEYGSCLSPDDCQKRGGTPNGPCAGGYGSCCVFVATCGTTVRENGTYFVNQGYPNSYDSSGSCQITLLKSQTDVCQFRLDFDQFQLMGPEPMNNMCNSDQFIVSGGSIVPTICGTNAGNHMYIDTIEGAANPVILSVVTSGQSFMRNWKIKVTQVPCSSNVKAEEGCLQYFTGVAGQIKSFNYDTANGLQLSNQDYSICIRTERNFCSVHYTQCLDPVNNRTQSFSLSGATASAVQAMVGSTGAANFCQSDYLIIPMAMNVGRPSASSSPTVDRICGGTFAADVTLISTTVKSNVKPFRLYFHTDGVETPVDIQNRGFCLNYVQQPCSNAIS